MQGMKQKMLPLLCVILTFTVSAFAQAPLTNAQLSNLVFQCRVAGWDPTSPDCASMPFWDTSAVTSMQNLFQGATTFNLDISRWNTARVVDMSSMFSNAESFNQNISHWDTSSVTNIDDMFSLAFAFNQNLSKWDTSSVTRLDGVFQQATAFNGDVSTWNVGNVERAIGTFAGAESFNVDISGWDVSRMRVTSLMFYLASSFNVNLCPWTATLNLDTRCNPSCDSDWLTGTPKLSICDVNECLDSTVDACGPGSMFARCTDGDSCSSSAVCHNTDGNFTCSMRTPFTNEELKSRVEACRSTDPIWDVSQPECADMHVWDTSMVTSMSGLFENNGLFNLDISRWDTSRVTDMSRMFTLSFRFNQDLSKWNTSSVRNMNGMFEGSASFPHPGGYFGDLSAWDVSRVTNMDSMFLGWSVYNGDLSRWDTGRVTTMRQMFSRASAFNGDISTWNVASVMDMRSMFASATSFNQHIGGWDTSNVVDMQLMFEQAASFNGDISQWNVSSVTGMRLIFWRAASFNGDISLWDVSSVTDMFAAFFQAETFNVDLCDWTADLHPDLNPSTIFYQTPKLSLCDVNECFSGNHSCSGNATCANTDGSFACTCNDGFESVDSGVTCVPGIDECFTGMDRCDEHAACTNTLGNYSCACNFGYSGGGFACMDDDECELGTHGCDDDAACANAEGAYTCTCKSGFVGNGKNCSDVDECTIMNTCSENATCTNTIGSFFCTCNAGLISWGNGTSCDIDECSSGTHNCAPDAECTDTEGSFVCQCSQGYEGDGVDGCLDVDECTAPNGTVMHNCDSEAACTNTNGSFTCTCNDGFESADSGVSCLAGVDECLAGIANCSERATCTNAIGNYTCTCAAGFTGNGFECEDDDECMLGTHTCHVNAVCANTKGAYNCSCKYGYAGDGISCTTTTFAAPASLVGLWSLDTLTRHHASVGQDMTNMGVMFESNDPDAPLPNGYALFDTSGNDVLFIPGWSGRGVGQPYTLEFWWKPLGGIPNSQLMTVFSYGTSSNFNSFVILDGVGNSNCEFGDNHALEVPSGDYCAIDGQWHHIAFTQNESLATFYRDGVEVFKWTGVADDMLVPGGTLVLGQEQDALGGGFEQTQAFSGYLKELRVWDEARTSDEIRNHMNLSARVANKSPSSSTTAHLTSSSTPEPTTSSSTTAATTAPLTTSTTPEPTTSSSTTTAAPHSTVTTTTMNPPNATTPPASLVPSDNTTISRPAPGSFVEITVFVSTLSYSFNAFVPLSDLVQDVKADFQQELGISTTRMVLSYNAVRLSDNMTLGTYGIRNGATVLLGICERSSCSDDELFRRPPSTPCKEDEALQCHSTAFCGDYGLGGKCFCAEGSVGDGISPRQGGSGCSRESWALRMTLDLGTDGLPALTQNSAERRTASNRRLRLWEMGRSVFSDILFRPTEKPLWFDRAMYHTVTDERFVTIYALFFTEEQAEAALDVFANHTSGFAVLPAVLFGSTNPRLTTAPTVATFVSKTSDAEIRILPTGMDVRDVYFEHNCLDSGCWVIDLMYTTGEDNFNTFYIPKAVGNDTLSFDFDYTAIPDYAAPYGKSPADTFLPINFPCGSDGYKYHPGPHIPDRVSACCIEEFTELYRPVESFVMDPHVANVLGAARNQTCLPPVFCAQENGTCTCDGRVQYGADGKYLYAESNGPIECTNAAFGGDPASGIAKTCQCSPMRKTWTKDEMPESALQGNFSGMNGLARVDFKTVEDPYVNQFSATVYLDEVALRQKAAVLTGQVGVAYAVDTFIGFANFKPTGLEFLDMFAAQTNIHLEKTNFFTVSVYGENEYTFLEYVNLRLITVLEEDVFVPFSSPRFNNFDVFHLTAIFTPYPPSPVTGQATLADDSQVWITEEADGGYRVHYYLTGLSASETQGGIHIHAGSSCESHDQVLGHYFSTPTDPWTTLWNKDVGATIAEGSVHVANPGFELSVNERHAFVVHEEDGERIACGVLRAVQQGRTSRTTSADYLQVTFTLGDQYQPIETGIIPIDSVLVSKGAFISDAETLETRFHACREYHHGTFKDKNIFDSRFPSGDEQLCAPNATMCYNPPHIPDQFVSFNVPLGIDWLPPASNNLDSNVFVDMVVSVIDAHQIAVPGGNPNDGDPAEQMKTTLRASIPVVEGGIYTFCDAIIRKVDLHDVAQADLIFGSAGYEYEFERLKVIKDLARAVTDPNATYIDTDSIEAGLMTLVVRGNESYFDSSASIALEVEDVITIHVMEPETGSKYRSVIDLLFEQGQDLNANDNRYALNGAFDFTIDSANQRPELQPSEALELLCPFTPQPPSPDDAFPATCVSRRDIRARAFPARDGKNATAIELPSANVPRDDPARNGVARFMQLVLNPSDYSAELGRNFSYIVAQKYELNDRYLRAWWINPGYEWTPQQTGGQTVFTLSQKIVLFALISLDEEFTGRRRRMLLQSATDNTGAGVSAQTATFDTSPQTLLAGIYNIPEELVGTFSVQLHLTQLQACMGEEELRHSIRATLDEYIAVSATHSETVQLVSMAVDRADVHCGARRALARQLLAFSAASATVEMMVVFSPSEFVAINLQTFANQEGIVAVTPRGLSSLIEVTEKDLALLPPTKTYKPTEDDPAAPSDELPSAPTADSADSSPGSKYVVPAIGLGAGIVAIVGGFAVFRQCQLHRATNVEIVDTLHVGDLRADLKSELVCPDYSRNVAEPLV